MTKRHLISLMLYFLLGSVEALANTITQNTRDAAGTKNVTDPRIFHFAPVHFRSDFSGARLNKITMVNDSTFQLLIEPENEPINKSGWYAFKMWSDWEKKITISLHYSYGEHRYAPKISADGKNWTPHITADHNSENVATYSLKISSDTTWFAAQEIVTADHVIAWADSLVAVRPDIEKNIIGKSIEGRPIIALRIGQTAPKPVLVLLSRQHPPEVTGQFALKAFVEELINNSQFSQQFLAQYSVIIFPLINPDGVAHGHWRNNMNGVDLNRDWSDFRQPETKAIKEHLEKQVVLGDSIVFALDFHSTKTDVFYIVTDHNDSLTQKWIDSLHATLPEAKINTSFHGVDSPTSKNWFYKRFGAEAVTYEVGDETDRVFLKILGRNAAVCLQTELINRVIKR